MAEPSLQTIVQRMIDAGESEANIATVIRHVHQTAPQRVSELEPGTYWAGFAKGAKEGMAGGAKGFVRGLADAPGDLVRAVGTMLTQNPVTTAEGMLRALPSRSGPGTVLERLGQAGVDPEGVGRDIGSATGQTMLTMAGPKVVTATGRAIPAGARVIGRAVGSSKIVPNLVKHGATVTGAAVGGPAGAVIGSSVGEALKDRLVQLMEARRAHQPTAAGYERYMPNEPAATPAASSATVPPPVQQGPVTPEQAVQQAGAFGTYGSQMPALMQPGTLSHEAQAALGMEAEPPLTAQERLSMDIGRRGTGPTVDLTAELKGPTAAEVRQARAVERFGRVQRSEGGPGRPPGPMTLSTAMQRVREAAKTANLSPTATELEAALQLVRAGEDPADLMEAIAIQRREALQQSPSFAQLPSDTDVAQIVASKNVGQKDVAARLAQRGPRTINEAMAEAVKRARQTSSGSNPFR